MTRQQPMHILYHHRTAGDRVEAVHILGLVRALRKLGHTVDISGPPGCNPERTERRYGAPEAAADPSPAPRERSGAPPLEGPLRGRLKRFARTAPPVLFELAELAYNVYALFDMAWRGRRKPELIIERATSNSIAPTALARWWNVPIVQEVNVTVETGRLRPLVLGDLTRRIERWVFRRATLLVTVSDEFKRLLVRQGYPAGKILVCQNAVDPEEFDPAAVQPEGRFLVPKSAPVVVGYVGAFVPWHRPEMMVEAARELAPEFPQARWLLVGDGVERAKVERLVSDYGLQERFRMAGSVTHRQVAALVSAMDVAVMPHSNPHGSPMKVFEYMAMARAVVAPDLPAIREVIRDGVNGLLFPAGDISGLARALRRLMKDEAFRRNLGLRARRDVLEKHTWHRNAQRVLHGVAERRSSIHGRQTG